METQDRFAVPETSRVEVDISKREDSGEHNQISFDGLLTPRGRTNRASN